MTWEAAVLFVVLFPILWSLVGRGTASPRLPTAAAPAPPADPDSPALPGGTMRAADVAGRPERPAPALEALDGPPLVSLEPLAPRPDPRRTARDAEPSRAEEHARFRRKDAAPPADPVAGAAPFLDARELRRAMLMAEVLGPPRSLRPLEDR
jgi:hypothetical protein